MIAAGTPAKTTIELTLRGRVLAWLAALAIGAAWLGADPNARLAAAMLTTPLVVDFVAKRQRLHRVELRVAARRTVAGAPFTESVTAVHRGRRALRECQLLEARTMRTEAPALLPALLPDEPVRVELRQRSTQRGHLHTRVFQLVTSWPLGMFRARAAITVAADLVTEPARVALRVDLARAVADTEVAPRDRTQLPGPEFHSLREHVLDEDARAVHALRSATLATLVRRITHGRLPRTVGVVLDLRRAPGRAAGASRRFEWNLGAAATLLGQLRANGVQVRALVLAAATTDLLVQGPGREAELLTLLAEASPIAHRALPPETFAALRDLEHCFWIPAGGHHDAPELAALTGAVVIGRDRE